MKQNYYNEFSDDDRRKRIFIIIIVILLLLSLSLISIGLYYGFFKDKDQKEKKYTKADLVVVHSKPEFGDTINSFASYNSSNSAYMYTFYVENKNKEDIYYDVKIESLINNNVDLTKINYSIYKNEELVFKGSLTDKSDTNMIKTKIISNTIDNYKLYLWSNEIEEINYRFKIRIES